uniref:Uncharacterized protein n=1 Tax=viral metagenome TaxID=1070528 RepID=A0A6C0HU65_9ZZZZ
MKKARSRKRQKGGGFISFICRNFCKDSKSRICSMLCDKLCDEYDLKKNTPNTRKKSFSVKFIPEKKVRSAFNRINKKGLDL